LTCVPLSQLPAFDRSAARADCTDCGLQQSASAIRTAERYYPIVQFWFRFYRRCASARFIAIYSQSSRLLVPQHCNRQYIVNERSRNVDKYGERRSVSRHHKLKPE
jgi:hypothetical protein